MPGDDCALPSRQPRPPVMAGVAVKGIVLLLPIAA